MLGGIGHILFRNRSLALFLVSFFAHLGDKVLGVLLPSESARARVLFPLDVSHVIAFEACQCVSRVSIGLHS